MLQKGDRPRVLQEGDRPHVVAIERHYVHCLEVCQSRERGCLEMSDRSHWGVISGD